MECQKKRVSLLAYLKWWQHLQPECFTFSVMKWKSLLLGGNDFSQQVEMGTHLPAVPNALPKLSLQGSSCHDHGDFLPAASSSATPINQSINQSSATPSTTHMQMRAAQPLQQRPTLVGLVAFLCYCFL